jgi:ABC-2 type transport system permease protein
MNFIPVMKRELKSYFYSPVAYVVLTMFLVLCGYFFFAMMSAFSRFSQTAFQNPQANVNITEMIVRPLFGNITFILLLIIPILTMRLFAEEKKSGTFELITTYPIKDVELVLGKLFACGGVFLVMLLLTFLYPLFMLSYSQPDPGVLLTAYLGLFLMGMAFISIGTFISSLTENQIIAAVMTFGLLLIFWVIGWVSSISEGQFGEVLNQLSLLTHYDNFAKGVIDLSDIIYYLSFIAFSIFLTLRSLESKKWRS